MTSERLLETLRRERPWDDSLLDEELWDAVRPALIADIASGDAYLRPEPVALPHPLKLYIGAEDDGTTWDIALKWRRLTTASFDVVALPGDHCFLETAPRILLERISADIAQLLL